MTVFGLYLWGDDHVLHVYDLGELDDLEAATEKGRDIMQSAHAEFVSSDSPRWQVAPLRSLSYKGEATAFRTSPLAAQSV